MGVYLRGKGNKPLHKIYMKTITKKVTTKEIRKAVIHLINNTSFDEDQIIRMVASDLKVPTSKVADIVASFE